MIQPLIVQAVLPSVIVFIEVRNRRIAAASAKPTTITAVVRRARTRVPVRIRRICIQVIRNKTNCRYRYIRRTAYRKTNITIAAIIATIPATTARRAANNHRRAVPPSAITTAASTSLTTTRRSVHAVLITSTHNHIPPKYRDSIPYVILYARARIVVQKKEGPRAFSFLFFN